MANVKKVQSMENEEVIEIKEVTSQQSQVDIMAMLLKMQEQQNQLTEQLDSLKKENDTLKSQKNNSNQSDDFNRLVTIKNQFTGMSLVVYLNEKRTDYLTLEGYGDTVKKRLIEVLDIVRLNKKWARLGYFAIEEEDIVNTYFNELIPVYEKTLSSDKFERLGTMNEEELIETYKNANFIFQRAIVDKFISEWAKGIDSNFKVYSKIDALSKASGVDIHSMINSVMNDDNKIKEFSK